MKILSLDIATESGVAVIDDEDTPSATRLWHFRAHGVEPEEKAASMRESIRAIKKDYNDLRYAVIELPLMMTPSYDKKQKADLATGTAQDQVALGRQMLARMTTVVERGGLNSTDMRAIIDDYFADEKTINPKTTALLNWLAGAAQITCMGMGLEVEFVRSQTWRTIMPKQIKDMKIDRKEKVRIYCDQLGIIGGDNNARDAAIMGHWCIRKSQKFKMFKQAVEQQNLF